MAATDDRHDPSRLLGHWALVEAEGDIETGDGVSAVFSPDGTLRYAIRSGDKLQVMILTYQVRGDILVTDQPSKPKRELTAFWFDSEGRLVLRSATNTAWFARDDNNSAA